MTSPILTEKERICDRYEEIIYETGLSPTRQFLLKELDSLLRVVVDELEKTRKACIDNNTRIDCDDLHCAVHNNTLDSIRNLLTSAIGDKQE